MKSQTIVVLESDPFSEFNALISNFMKQNWHITPYQIVFADKFDSLRRSSNLSFLYITQTTISDKSESLFFGKGSTAKENDNSVIKMLNLSMGHSSGDISKMPDIALVPLAYYIEIDDDAEDDVEEPSYGYKLGVLLKMIQYFVSWHEANPNGDFDKHVQASTKELKNKTLYLLNNEVESRLRNTDVIRQNYPWPLFLVKPEQMESYIINNREDAVILHKVGPESYSIKNAWCLKILISTSNGRPYYYHYHKITANAPDAFLIEDLKRLSSSN